MHMVFALYYFLDTSCRMEIFMSLVDSIWLHICCQVTSKGAFFIDDCRP